MERSSSASASSTSSSLFPLPHPLSIAHSFPSPSSTPSASSAVFSASFSSFSPSALQRLAPSPSPSSSPSSSSPASEVAGQWMSPSSSSSSSSTPSASSPTSPSPSLSSSSLQSSGLHPRVRHDKHRRNASEVRRRSEMKDAFLELQAAAACSQSGRYHVLTKAAAVIRSLQATVQRLRDEGAAHHIQRMTGSTGPASVLSLTSPSSSSASQHSSSSPSSPSSSQWLSAASALCAGLPLPSCLCVAAPVAGSLLSANDAFLALVDSVSLPFLLQTHSLTTLAHLHSDTPTLLRRAMEGGAGLDQDRGGRVKEERGGGGGEQGGGGGGRPFPSFPALSSSLHPSVSTRLLHTEAVTVSTLGGELRPCHASFVLCQPSAPSPSTAPLLLCIFAPLLTPLLSLSQSASASSLHVSASLHSSRPSPPPSASVGQSMSAVQSSLASHNPAPPQFSLMGRLPPPLPTAMELSAPSQPFPLPPHQLSFHQPPSTSSVSFSSSHSSPSLPSQWSASLHQHGFPHVAPPLPSSSHSVFPPSSSAFSSSSSPSLSLRSLDGARVAHHPPSNAPSNSSQAATAPFSRSSSPAPFEAPPLLSSSSPTPFSSEAMLSQSGPQSGLAMAPLQSQWWLQWAAKAAQQPPPSSQPQLPFNHPQRQAMEALMRGGGGGGWGGHGGAAAAPSLPLLGPFHPPHFSLPTFDAAPAVERPLASSPSPPFDYFHPPRN